MRRRLILPALLLAAALAGPAAWAQPWEARFVPLAPLPPLAPIPARGLAHPGGHHFVLDDGTREGAVGITEGQSAKPFLWFNQVDVPAPGAHVDLVEVLFPSGDGMAVGLPVDIVLYHDPDADPSNGATLLRVIGGTVQTLDALSSYAVVPPVSVTAPGSLLVGVVPRWIVGGVTPPVAPAALDATDPTPEPRSWLALWPGDPPTPPLLPPAGGVVEVVGDLLPGNAGYWMVRAEGRLFATVEVPALAPGTLAALAALLGAAGAAALARRRR